ncbi:MAG TPA: lipoyl(octanoyl) transferase LipB [Polyangiaceae bacterium]|nr:lipoyl(octanoyl) transferase LipB [Polyangiaceae bacterium]
MKRQLSGYFLGQRDYRSCLALQQELHAARSAGSVGDTVLLVEHPAVITLGRGGHAEHLLASRDQLRELGVDVVETGRGGDITLHAPGQLVCYPIVDLSPDRKDVRRYVRDLTEVMRRVTAEHGVESGRIEQHIGLWANRQSPSRFRGESSAADLVKLGAIGVRISRWITMHGFALNLKPDMRLFSLIVPCGIREYGVASLGELMDRPGPTVAQTVSSAFGALIRVLDADPDASTLTPGDPPPRAGSPTRYPM